jgi:hypothetical protein
LFPSFLSIMLSHVTPRIEATLDSMTPTELQRLQDAVDAGAENIVHSMMFNKDPLTVLEQDPILYSMINDNMSWADLMEVMPKTARRVLEYKQPDPDADWDMPVLRLRKHIWEHFPVDVIPVPTKDAAERYGVRWNARKFAEAEDTCSKNCEHGWEFLDFEEDLHRRLLKALQASRYWTVEEAQSTEDICIIAMNFQTEKQTVQTMQTMQLPSMTVSDMEKDNASVASNDTAESKSKSWEKVCSKNKNSQPESQQPLSRLNDIKARFPVIWNEVQGCKSTTYALEIFGKKVKEQGLNLNRVKADLMTALTASKAWTVLPAKDPKHVCLLRMNHA